MIESLIHSIQTILIPLGAIGVFLASILEEVVAPIPSAFVLMTAGFFLVPDHAWTLASLGKIFFVIAIPGALGVTLGSLIVYGIGYWAGKPLLLEWGNYFGISWGEVEKMERRFERGYSDEVTLFIVRAVPVIPSVIISAFCGLIRLPVREYLVFSFLGMIIRAFVLALIGWQVGGVYERFAGFISQVENKVFAAAVIGGIFLIGYRIMKKKTEGFIK